MKNTLENQRFKDARRRAEAGLFLSLTELSAATGIGQNRMRRIAKQPGFPLFEKKVRLVDFEHWYRQKIGLVMPVTSNVELPKEASESTDGLARIRRLAPRRLVIH